MWKWAVVVINFGSANDPTHFDPDALSIHEREVRTQELYKSPASLSHIPRGVLNNRDSRARLAVSLPCILAFCL